MSTPKNAQIGDDFPEPHMKADAFDDGTPATVGEPLSLVLGATFGTCVLIGLAVWAWRAWS